MAAVSEVPSRLVIPVMIRAQPAACVALISDVRRRLHVTSHRGCLVYVFICGGLCWRPSRPLADSEPVRGETGNSQQGTLIQLKPTNDGCHIAVAARLRR